ncbi:SAM-dependent DNA methyltransferase [Actinopolyspora erythraea]|uniref:site-specific DNA-methyltransferase (adenine-specific) n=1 Tax=Actinopolyspora erythraea TaxID=414996 RepID=A0A099D5G4_9ACTN|nr:class I SAM-dependent DNA methyltransferase [Actinopolyspora erythraea]ASU78948.1 SAM-dependent DNA methyltransferase [Actinopolyspora erythraea]KGI81284.1 restriction endonuclease subunit M [Actinopolyspora erythraea]
MSTKDQELANFIWSVADLLRGDFKQSDYGKVILPLTVLRRLDCVLEPTRVKVLERKKHATEQLGVHNTDRLLKKESGFRFYNTSKFTFSRDVEGLTSLLADQDQVGKNLRAFIGGFSEEAAEILEKYDFDTQINRMEAGGILYQVVGRFASIDLHPDRVSNQRMGYLFEELIRRFSEISNETAGEHFTPREVIKLMTNLLLDPDHDKIVQPGATLRVLDPACGTGGMLSAAEDVVTGYNANATVTLFGQELNPESYAICKSDLLIKGQEAGNIANDNSFSHDRHYGKRFDYLLANPPFGVEWKKVREDVEREADLGHAGRFGAGLPRINDGSLLFLQHMIAHMKPVHEGGSRVAIVFNGSPLFTGAAESGESNIRRWILENDWLEGIVALPDQLFYNTGISTYFWILSNNKAERDRGKVTLLDAREYWAKMRKSLGDKRKYITEEQIEQLTRLYNEARSIAADENHELHDKVKIFDTTDFGYQRITVERPLRQRFEVTEQTLAEVDNAKSVSKYEDREALLAALRGLVGHTWWKKVDFDAAFRQALAESGAGGKLPTPVNKAVTNAVAVSDPEGELQTDKTGAALPDPDLRDNENVPLGEDIDEYLNREVLPHVPDAWVDHSKTKIGYEIPFTRYFYKYVPPRPLEEIDAELKSLESEIQRLLSEVTE